MISVKTSDFQYLLYCVTWSFIHIRFMRLKEYLQIVQVHCIEIPWSFNNHYDIIKSACERTHNFLHDLIFYYIITITFHIIDHVTYSQKIITIFFPYLPCSISSNRGFKPCNLVHLIGSIHSYVLSKKFQASFDVLAWKNFSRTYSSIDWQIKNETFSLSRRSQSAFYSSFPCVGSTKSIYKIYPSPLFFKHLPIKCFQIAKLVLPPNFKVIDCICAPVLELAVIFVWSALISDVGT